MVKTRALKTSRKKDKTNWQHLRKMSDEEIDCSEIPDMSSFDWTQANIVLPQAKTRMTIRIDTDVYQYFKAQGPKYQSRINSVLKSYMLHDVAAGIKRKRRRAVAS